MNKNKVLNYIGRLLENIPADWRRLTTHRLDIYEEKKAKVQFLEAFTTLFQADNSELSALAALPTAYDYIRLGHPLSSVLEWTIAHLHQLSPSSVISFSSRTTPVLAVLRKNLLDQKNTLICYSGEWPAHFDVDTLRQIYGYKFDIQQVENAEDVTGFNGSTVFISQQTEVFDITLTPHIDIVISTHPHLGSILVANNEADESYIPAIQHVRRRETIAMTPANCQEVLKMLINTSTFRQEPHKVAADKKLVLDTLKTITGTTTQPLLGSSGLSVQYAIMMGLIHDAQEKHPGKDVKIVIPPNCYGGTNDQARRVAACLNQVEIVDLPVDAGNDMVKSVNLVLDRIAKENAVPYIIAEIPTNPRVEVPDLIGLRDALSKERQTSNGEKAIAPVFILDQTFCPNVHFLGEGEILSTVSAIAYASGSKFPSGGLCTAGYCVSNLKAAPLMEKINLHLQLCDNEATDLQLQILAKQLPSMNRRIAEAYQNTRAFVNFIQATLPDAKINFVSEELAEQGFTPSVFSLDLPTKGATPAEREAHKRALNHQLIRKMIAEIPNESKHCVSYGQLKGCYWTIPATSTQGTTKESDKDYIARVALSPNMDVERHKEVFADFVAGVRGEE